MNIYCAARSVKAAYYGNELNERLHLWEMCHKQ